MEAKLVHTETGRCIAPGRMMRHEDGTSWRYEHPETERAVTEHTLIHCSRITKVGRVHRVFHPRVFGCVLSVDATLYVDRAQVKKFVTWWGVQLAVLTVGGFIAWLIAHQMGA